MEEEEGESGGCAPSGNRATIKQKSIILSKVRDLWRFSSGGGARGAVLFTFPCPTRRSQDDNTLIVPSKNKKEGTQTQAFFIRRTPSTEENRSKNAQGEICQQWQRARELHGSSLFAVVTVPLCSRAYECVTLFKMHNVVARDFSIASTFSIKHQECVVKSNGVNKSDVSLRRPKT